jgi:subtilisin-like proprotein convertase family protein
MKKTLLLFVLVIATGQIFAQKNAFWQVQDARSLTNVVRARPDNVCQGELYFTLNVEALKQTLVNAKGKFSNLPGVPVTFPNSNGELETFLVWENSNFEPLLQSNFPQIRSYVGKGVTDKYATINFSVSPLGLQTMVFRADNGTEFIEGYDKAATTYVLFNAKDRVSGRLPFTCGTNEVNFANDISNKVQNTTLADNAKYKTFRLALSCTAEYANYFGATSSADVALVLAGMNATMTRVNGVMEKDLSLHLNIISTTDQVIYYDPSSDPYSDATIGSDVNNSGNATGWNIQLQNALTTTLGNAAYDIGHLFGASGGGGNAGCIGCVCVDDSASTTDKNKGSGFTSPSNNVPAGDSFDIDYVAHEMGHQLGANHTFTYNYEGTVAQTEPGSGSTIMAYAGVASTTAGAVAYNVQNHSDALYSYKSISQIQTKLNSASANCSVNTVLTGINATPTADGGLDHTIPVGTAFKLTGVATDADAADALTYIWEQNNAGTSSTTQNNSRVSGSKTAGPNFRTFAASASPMRYFPQLSKVLVGNLVQATGVDTEWESCSSVGRTLNFTFTVRDNHPGAGQTKTDTNVIITVLASAGPFAVTSQSASSINWIQGSSQTITWDVANTTSLPGSANVNIKLSTDGGLNFDTVLASNTPNDGTETITVPAVSALNCRIMVEAADNVYFAVNSKAFSIGADCHIYATTPNAAIADGTGSSTAGATTTSVINVPDAFTISNLKVNLKVDHTKIGDLIVKITHPDGTLRTLWNRTCNSAAYSGIDMTFADGTGSIASACASPTTGTHQASQASTALAGYNNKTSAGNWTLTITDNAATNTGTLVTWALDFGCTLATNEFEIADLTIYPNPNRGNFNIKFDNPSANEVTIAVYDMSGRRIFENNYASQASFNENIQLNNAQAGIYLVNVTDGSKKIVKKIIVE